MRFLAPTALLAAVVLILACLAVAPGAAARATTDPAAPGITHSTVATPGTTAAGQGRTVAPGTADPQTLFGKWWKKFKRVMERILDFIDGLLDDLKPHTGDDPKVPPTTSAVSPGSPPGAGWFQPVALRPAQPLLA